MQRLLTAIAALCDGGWLDRRRVGIGAGVLLALQLVLFAFFVAGTHGWIIPITKATTTDFVSFYAAGQLADAGTPALAYDHAAHLAAEEAVVGRGIVYQFFNYPPVFMLLCAALAKLPYLTAFILFEVATLALYLVVATRILGERSGVALAALLGFPMMFWNFGLGQNAFLTAGLFGAATLALDRRPVLAGLLFGALCYKPQFGLMVPLALAAAGQWRAIVAAGAAAGGMVLLSLALFGGAAWHAFLAGAGGSTAMYESGRILFAGMATGFGAARLLGAGPAVAYAVQAAVSFAAAGIVIVVWRRGASLTTRMAVLASASFVAAPLALFYDLMLGTLAALWLLRDRTAPAAAGWEGPALAALYVALFFGRGLEEKLHVPVFPLAALAVLAMAAARAWRENALREAAPLRDRAPAAG